MADKKIGALLLDSTFRRIKADVLESIEKRLSENAAVAVDTEVRVAVL